MLKLPQKRSEWGLGTISLVYTTKRARGRCWADTTGRWFRATLPWRWASGLAALVLLMGCASVGGNPPDAPEAGSDEQRAVGPIRPAVSLAPALRQTVHHLLQTPPGGSGWATWPLPGKAFAAFEPAVTQGQRAITVKANRSVSILRQRYAPGLDGAGHLVFSWRIDALAEGADLATSEGDDSPVRIVLAFDGDRSRLSPRMHRLSEMSRLLTGEDLPYATLAYVWSNTDAPGEVVVNRRSDRIRKIVVESGPAHVGRWMTYERDVEADFRAAFGEAPGPLIAVGLMTDTDNTQSRLQAWYGPLHLQRRASAVEPGGGSVPAANVHHPR